MIYDVHIRIADYGTGAEAVKQAITERLDGLFEATVKGVTPVRKEQIEIEEA